MSYEKAMKHARSVRKSKKQRNMDFGWNTGYSYPQGKDHLAVQCLLRIHEWFRDRHRCAQGSRYIRECIHEEIETYRKYQAMPRPQLPVDPESQPRTFPPANFQSTTGPTGWSCTTSRCGKPPSVLSNSPSMAAHPKYRKSNGVRLRRISDHLRPMPGA